MRPVRPIATRLQRYGRGLLPALLTAVLLPAAVFGAVPPPWVRMLPEAEGKVYAVGVAAIATTPAAAGELAGRAARFELLARLKSAVRARSDFQTTFLSRQTLDGTGAASRFQRAVTTGELVVAELPIAGISIEETFLDEGTRTAYALAALDTAAAYQGCALAYERLARARRERVEQPPGSALAKQLALRRLLAQADELAEVLLLLAPFRPCGPLCDDVLALRQELATASDKARHRNSCGMDPHYPVPLEIAAIIRNQLETLGCSWRDVSPDLQVAAQIDLAEQVVDISRLEGAPPGPSQPFYGQRLIANLTLKDAAGVPYDSFSFAVKGIGIDPASARQALRQNFAVELGARLGESAALLLGDKVVR